MNTEPMNTQRETAKAMLRHAELEAAETRDRLSRSLLLQAETIAHHYLAHFNEARDLADLVRMRRFGDPSAQTDQCIAQLVGNLQRNHMADFGIALEWPLSTDRPFPMGDIRPNYGHGELTGDYAFAAAIAAGIPAKCMIEDGKAVLQLAHQVSVHADGDTIKVFRGPS